MKFKKAAALFLLLLTLLLLFCGCHGKRTAGEFKLPESFNEKKDYSITFWAKNDTNKTQTEIYESAIKGFEELYPNIKVTLRLYTDYGRIYNDVITNIKTDTTPNVCITYPDHIATYLLGNDVVVPLDALISDEKFGLGGESVKFDSPKKEEISEKFLNECLINGHLYALPFMRSTEACYINKTYVEALGYTLPDVLTWDFVYEVTNKAAKKDENGNYILNGKKVMLPFIYKSTDNMMIQQLKQLGGGYSDDSGKVLLFNEVTKSLLYTVAEQTANGAFSTFKISGYPANFLNAGQCVFAVDSTAGSTWMGTNAPLSDISEEKLVEFETEVMPIPQFDVNNPQMISQGPSVCVFNKKDSDEVLASWLFAQYLLTNEVQIAYSQTEGYVPVTLKAQNSAEYKSYLAAAGSDDAFHYEVKLKAVKLLLDNIDNTFVTPVFSGSASLRDAAGQLIENVTKSVKRKEKIDDAYMEKLFSDVTSLYRLKTDGNAKTDFGALPKTSVFLLSALAVAWFLIILALLIRFIKQKRRIDS